MYFVIDNETQAAVTIQSIWRGYRARQRHPDVVRVRLEMRSRRSEDHIRNLREQLTRYYHIIIRFIAYGSHKATGYMNQEKIRIHNYAKRQHLLKC